MKRALLCFAVIGTLGVAAGGARAASLPVHGRTPGPRTPPAWSLREQLSARTIRSLWLGDRFRPGPGPAPLEHLGRRPRRAPKGDLSDWRTRRGDSGCGGSVNPIPEPGTAALYLVGAGLAAFVLRRARD